MIKCISYWSMEQGLSGTHPIEDALLKAKSAGFQGLELCIGVDGVLTPDTSQAECEKIRHQVDASGLIVETLASGMSWAYSPTSNDADVCHKAMDLHAKALQRASWLGCQAMLFVPGVVKSPIAPNELIRYDLAVARARDAVASLLEVAERVDVDLCLENVWNGLFYSPLEFAQFIDSFKSRRLGIYFDVGNVLGYQQHPPHWIELLGQRIKRVHIKDYRETFDWQGSYSFCELGEGDVPWKATVEALTRIGYDRTIVAEMLPYKPGQLERTRAAMDRMLGKK
ncbi:MAG: sugar phosphate isomerase/epimerase [Pirellulales bacterium]|nr:sugar phosphate isomerase/epimerase [Pirellulales bacterium]